MKAGNIKHIDNKGLQFDLKALDEYALIFDEKIGSPKKRQLGIVVSDVPSNKYGIKKGMKMLISKINKKEN